MNRQGHLRRCIAEIVRLQRNNWHPPIPEFLDEYNREGYIDTLWDLKIEGHMSPWQSFCFSITAFISFFLYAWVPLNTGLSDRADRFGMFLMRIFHRSPKIKPEEIERLLLLQ